MTSLNLQPLASENASQFRHLDAPTQARVQDLQTRALPPQALRRTGLRPYAFNGVLVAMVSGITPALPYWYELNVYRTVLGTYVSDVRLFQKDSDRSDLFRVEEHADLDAVMSYFESYDPADDLQPAAQVMDQSTSNTRLALAAARLQMEVNQISDHYKALIGTFLQDLAMRSA
jgi:hypothetical protein